MAQVLRGYIYEIPFRGVAMLPINRVARRIDEALQLAHRLSQHGSVEFLASWIAPFIFGHEVHLFLPHPVPTLFILDTKRPTPSSRMGLKGGSNFLLIVPSDQQ